MTNKKRFPLLVVGVVSAILAQAAWAQAPSAVKPQYAIGGAKPADDSPRGIGLADGVTFFPKVKLGLGRDDNMFLGNTNKTKSSLFTLDAGGLIEARQQNRVLGFGLDSRSANYFDSSADNYRDYTAFGNGDFQINSRAGLRLGAQYERGHDPRGSTDRGISASPDVYRDTGLSGLFAYGGNDARGRFELAASSNDKRYRNNRAATEGADRQTDRFRGTFFARVMPKTSFLVEYQHADFDYQLSSSTLDSKESRFYAGVTWEATAATAGTIKIGRQKKEFSGAGRADASGSSWEIGVEWTPLTYSKVDLFATKGFSESSGVGDFILNKRAGVVWTHSWSSRIETAASYTLSKDDFLGAGANRKDETDTFGVKLTYKLGRNMELGADWTHSDRDSNSSLFQYKRNLFMVTLGARL